RSRTGSSGCRRSRDAGRRRRPSESAASARSRRRTRRARQGSPTRPLADDLPGRRLEEPGGVRRCARRPCATGEQTCRQRKGSQTYERSHGHRLLSSTVRDPMPAVRACGRRSGAQACGRRADAVHVTAQTQGKLARACLYGTTVVLAVFVVHAAWHFGGAAGDQMIGRWLNGVLGVAPGAFCVARGLTQRRERAPWLLLGLGSTAWGIGNLYFLSA